MAAKRDVPGRACRGRAHQRVRRCLPSVLGLFLAVRVEARLISSFAISSSLILRQVHIVAHHRRILGCVFLVFLCLCDRPARPLAIVAASCVRRTLVEQEEGRRAEDSYRQPRNSGSPFRIKSP